MITNTEYSDIDLSFSINNKGDIYKFYNEKSLTQAIKNIVMMKNKLFKPSWGADVKKYLFSNMNNWQLNNLRDEIETKIYNNEKRFNYLRVNLNINPLNEHELNVSVKYRFKFLTEIRELNFKINFLK